MDAAGYGLEIDRHHFQLHQVTLPKEPNAPSKAVSFHNLMATAPRDLVSINTRTSG